MAKDVVRMALVGAGGYAAAHLVTRLPLYKGLAVVAICDTDAEAAGRAARITGATTVTADLAEVLRRDDIDMVEFHTPNFLHADQAVAALGAGKHVLVQKPMATSLAEARRMIRAARDAKRLLGVNMDDFDDPMLVDMKAAIRAGFIGRPVAFRMRYAHQGGLSLKPGQWRCDAKLTGGGSFILLTVHNIAAVDWIFDTRVRRVAGMMKTLMAPMEGDDTTAAAVELENGLIGTAESSYLSVGCPEVPNTVTEIRGTEGCIGHQRDDSLIHMFSFNRTFHGQLVHYDKPGTSMRFMRAAGQDAHPTLHEQFAIAILEGKPFVSDGEAGMHDLAVCQAIAESSRTGRAIDIREFIEKA